MDTIDRFKIQHFVNYIKKLKDYDDLSKILKHVSNSVVNPRFDQVVAEPVDFNQFFQESFNDGSVSLSDFFECFNKMLQNFFQYYEPESLAYRAALNLQRFSLERFSRLNCQEIQFPNTLPSSVQEILLSIFVETYNYVNVDGKYLSESILKLPANGWVDGVWKRVETLETIKRRLDRGLYSNLEELQSSLFNVFSRARQSWQLNKDLYKDSIELQGAYLNIRNTLCQHGNVLNPQAFSFGLNDLLIAVQNEKQCLSLDINAEDQILSPDVRHHSAIINQFGETFNIGDFIYVNPLEFDSVSDCLIMEIHKIITDKDGQNMVYGWQFLRPQDINIYHGHLFSVGVNLDELCLFTTKFHIQELLKCDKFLFMPLSKVVKKCFIVTPFDYSNIHLGNVFSPDIYICRYLYKFSNQKFEKLVMDHSQSSFSTDMEKDVHLLFDMKVSKRIQQWSKLDEHTESIRIEPQLIHIQSNSVMNDENLATRAADQSVDQLRCCTYQSSVRLSQVTSGNFDGSPFEIHSTEQILQLASFESIEGTSNVCQERGGNENSQPLHVISEIKTENVEADFSKEDSDKHEFTLDDIYDGVLFTQCNSVVGTLTNGDYVYIQSEPETEKFIVQISDIILSKAGEFLIIGTKFIIQEKTTDTENEALPSFNEAYWYQQSSVHPVSRIEGRCMVLNFQDYIHLRPSSISEVDVYLCEFILDRSKHCLYPLNSGMPELLHKEVTKVKMQRVSENFVYDLIGRRHVIFGKPIPILSNKIGKNTAIATPFDIPTNPVNNLRISNVSVKKELDETNTFELEESSVDKFKFWQKDLLSWLKGQKRLSKCTSNYFFKKQAERYSRIYKLSGSLKSNIKYFKKKHRNIIFRLQLIKESHGHHTPAKKRESAIQEYKNKDRQRKFSCLRSKAADRCEVWQKDLLIWLRRQKQMNNVVSCEDFKKRAYYYCTIYQLTDKVEYVRNFKQEYENIISSEQLIMDDRFKKWTNKRKNQAASNEYLGNEFNDLKKDTKIWRLNLLSWLRDERKQGCTTSSRDFFRKSISLYRDLRLQTSLVELIIHFKKKYSSVISNEKLIRYFKQKMRCLTMLESNEKVKSFSVKNDNSYSSHDTSKVLKRKRGRPPKEIILEKKNTETDNEMEENNYTHQDPTKSIKPKRGRLCKETILEKNPTETKNLMKSRELKRLLLSGVTPNVSVAESTIYLRSDKAGSSKLYEETSDNLELESGDKDSSVVPIPNEIIKIWERELLHWLRTKKRLCKTVSMKDFNEKASHFQNILHIESPLEPQVKSFKEKYQEDINKECLIMFNSEMEPSEPEIKSVYCSKGCSFYGSADTLGLCSKCYRDYLAENQSSCELVLLKPKRETASKSSSPSISSGPPCTSNSSTTNVSVKSALRKAYFNFKKLRYQPLKTKLPDFSKSQLDKVVSSEWKVFPIAVKLSYNRNAKDEEGNKSDELVPTNVRIQTCGKHQEETIEAPQLLEESLVAEKVTSSMPYGRTFQEEIEEMERRKRLCVESFQCTNQNIVSGKELNEKEKIDSICLEKYLEQLVEFFELPPDDLESYATFKWLQPTMNALQGNKNSPNGREKEDKVNETWLNYGPKLAKLALVHKLKENSQTLGEFKQLAMSTPLLQIPKMSLAYENML